MYTPVDVTMRARLPLSHLEELRAGDDLCRALAPMLDVWREHARYPDDVAALLHDPLAIACAVDRRFATVERLPVTVAIHEGVVRTFIDRVEGKDADVVTSVDASAFADFWLETVLRPG
jgi:inosine-uridine nucleoside N-ribohydrolase